MSLLSFGEFAESEPPAPVKKLPIRPIGFVSLWPSAIVAGCATSMLLLVCSGCVLYFNELRKYDWLSRINPYEQALFDVVVEGQSPDLSRSGPTAGVSRSQRSNTKAEQEYFRELLTWFPTTLCILTAAAMFDLIAFMIWQWRAHRNLATLGSEGLRFGSSTALVWWFVPVAVFWMPRSVVQEIWRGSDPGVPVGDAHAWRLRPGSFLIDGWWCLAVLSKGLYWWGGLMLVLWLTSLLSPIALLAIAFAITANACGLQIALIRRVTQRQAKLYERRTLAAEKALAAGQSIVDARIPQAATDAEVAPAATS